LTLGVALVSQAEFPTPYNSEKDKDAQPISPGEALSLMELPEGFSATIYAAEPDIANPIAMAWDHKGRMWVAENNTYAERPTRFELGLRDRVTILEDKDGDGRAETRKVFTDDVQMLTSVEVGRGGVWLMCPPQVLFIPDANGDDIPDGPPEVVLDGFTVAEANYHNYANGLRWGPDGWLYGRCGHSCPGDIGLPGAPPEERLHMEGGIWRYHPVRKDIEVLNCGTTNPWGHDWDEHGQLFYINTVNGHLWHVTPGVHFKENFGADPNPFIFDRMDMHADHWHFDTSGKWQDSRAGAANEYGGGHAHIGMMVYQADQWPEKFRGRLYTMNMHGLRTNVERMERHGSGYIGRHQDDVFIMGDKWFRGIDLQQGPDGSVYMLDWSDTGECHEHSGVHRTSGRIYRVSYGEPERPDLKDLEEPDAGVVKKLLSEPNVWFERQLRNRVRSGALSSSDRAATVKVAREVLSGGDDDAVRLRALWLLNELGEANGQLLESLLADSSEHLRVWSIRLLTDQQPLDGILGMRESDMPEPLSDSLLKRFETMARKDESGLVRLTLASTLLRLPVEQRAQLAAPLMAHAGDADDHNLPHLVWAGISGIARRSPEDLAALAKNNTWAQIFRWSARSLAVQSDKEPAALDAFLKVVTPKDHAVLQSVLQGMSEGYQGWRKADEPRAWKRLAARLKESSNSEVVSLVRDLGVLFGDGRALDAIKEVVLDRSADLNMRLTALKTLIESKPDDLRAICESLLGERHINTASLKGLALYEDSKIGDRVAQNYRRFFSPERPAVIEVLVSRASWARALLEEMRKNRIPKADLSAFQARQIRSFEDKELSGLLASVWGEVNESSEEKHRLIEEWTGKLTRQELDKADLSRGRQLFTLVCGTCHKMYGEGGAIGPDLTGSGRADLGYLLENIIDPSAVVSADFMMSTLNLKDGRTLTGIVSSENSRTLTLRQASGEETLEKSAIEKREVSSFSMMPEGLITALDPRMVRDLIAYLQHPSQVPLP